MSVIRKRYIFYGSVQGVGFRYRAYYAAREYGVSGWVKNLYDGSVELEAEGSPESIEAMLLAIEKGRFVRILDFKCEEIPAKGDTSFEIVG